MSQPAPPVFVFSYYTDLFTRFAVTVIIIIIYHCLLLTDVYINTFLRYRPAPNIHPSPARFQRVYKEQQITL